MQARNSLGVAHSHFVEPNRYVDPMQMIAEQLFRCKENDSVDLVKISASIAVYRKQRHIPLYIRKKTLTELAKRIEMEGLSPIITRMIISEITYTDVPHTQIEDFVDTYVDAHCHGDYRYLVRLLHQFY